MEDVVDGGLGNVGGRNWFVYILDKVCSQFI